MTTQRRPRRTQRPWHAQSVSLRGPTYARIKAAAAERGVRTSELIQGWLAESEAIQMKAPEEYALLQRLVAKRRAAEKEDDDIRERMHIVWLELSDNERRVADPPPDPQPKTKTKTPFFTNQPVVTKPSPPRPKAQGSGYCEF